MNRYLATKHTSVVANPASLLIQAVGALNLNLFTNNLFRPD